MHATLNPTSTPYKSWIEWKFVTNRQHRFFITLSTRRRRLGHTRCFAGEEKGDAWHTCYSNSSIPESTTPFQKNSIRHAELVRYQSGLIMLNTVKPLQPRQCSAGQVPLEIVLFLSPVLIRAVVIASPLRIRLYTCTYQVQFQTKAEHPTEPERVLISVAQRPVLRFELQ